MQEDLVILLEWLNANGINELFSDNIERKNSLVEKLAEQQTELKTNSFNKIEYIRSVADKLNTIDSIFNFVKNDDVYANFRRMSSNSVITSGNIDSKVLIINDIPNDGDDKNGKIFSCNDGILLKNMMSSINIKDYALLNNFFWRLPGNRTPIREEIELCKPIVEKIISIIDPKLIILTGNYSVSTLVEKNKTILNIKNKIIEYTNCYTTKNITLTGIYSPNFILKNINKKKESWQSLINIKNFI